MEQHVSTALDHSAAAVLLSGLGLTVRCVTMTAGMQEVTCAYMVHVLMQTGLHLDSLNISASVRVAGMLHLGIRPALLMWMSVTYQTNPAPPTLLFPASTPWVPSTVEPVQQVGKGMATAVRMWMNA